MIETDQLSDDVKGLIFDIVGTLVDTPPLYTRAWVEGFRLSGREMTPDGYLARAGMSKYVLMDAFEAEHRLDLRRDSVVRRMGEALIEGLDEIREIAAITAIARANSLHGSLDWFEGPARF